MSTSERGSASRRFLDRIFGIPLVMLASLARRKRKVPRRLKTIALLKTAAIGDTVLLSAILRDLRSAFPDASIDFYTGGSNSEIVAMADGFDRLVIVPIIKPFQALRVARACTADVIVDFESWPRINALFCWATNTGCTIGFRTKGQLRHFAYDIAVDHEEKSHELDNYRRLIRVLGVAGTALPALNVPPFESTWDSFGPYAVCHMWPGGSRARQKEWPPGCWRELILDLLARNLQVVLTGNRVDLLRSDAFRALHFGSDRRVRSFCGKLGETASLLKHAEIVISVDTGVLHVASAVDTPVVGLYGPTSAKRWGPLGERSLAVESRLSGCGEMSLGFENNSAWDNCMAAIPVCDVIAAIDRLVQKNASREVGERAVCKTS